MGSKSRITKEIVPIIQKCIDDNHIIHYIEPFVGGGNVIDKVQCLYKYGYDLNKYLIALLRHVAEGGKLLDEVPRDLYNEVRANKDKYADWYVGCVGFLASVNGRFFDGGYAQPGYEKTKTGTRYRDYYQEAKRNLERQAPNLKGTRFEVSDYINLNPGTWQMIYCDPPYASTKKFANAQNFNYEVFWIIMRLWSKHNFVIISEQSAPDDFVCIWEKKVNRSMNAVNKFDSTEKLFVWSKGLYADRCLKE